MDKDIQERIAKAFEGLAFGSEGHLTEDGAAILKMVDGTPRAMAGSGT